MWSIISLFCITYHTTCYLQRFAVESGLTVYTVKPNFERRTTTMLFVIEHHVPCVRLPNICHVLRQKQTLRFLRELSVAYFNCKNADPPFPEIEFRGFRLFLCDESKFCPFRWHLIVIAKPTEPDVCVAKLTRGIFGNSFMRHPA